jgi:hypothetical protein
MKLSRSVPKIMLTAALMLCSTLSAYATELRVGY